MHGFFSSFFSTGTVHFYPMLQLSGRLGPLFFDERSDACLPPVEELKEYGVVVTTYQRLTNEQPRWSDSPLSRIYWLRMVLVSARCVWCVWQQIMFFACTTLYNARGRWWPAPCRAFVCFFVSLD